MGAMMVAVRLGIEKLFERYRDECLTPEDVGDAIGLEPGTIRRQLRDGDLPGYRLGTGAKAQWRLVKSEVIAVLASRWNQNQPSGTNTTIVQAGADGRE
jgi:hypothetical protein